ncbi:MAG: hypothetical protein NTW82_14050 [Bacteroidia bacterium]|nr:hypothetical protein [Bacteroidia bacterium]
MLDKVKIAGKEYYSIELFMIIAGLRSRRSVYAWVDQGKAEKKKIGSNSFFAKL